MRNNGRQKLVIMDNHDTNNMSTMEDTAKHVQAPALSIAQSEEFAV